MSTLLIRKLPEGTKSRLRVRATRNGRSMEQEAREILNRALVSDEPEDLHFVDRIRRHVEKWGGIDIPEIPREPAPEPIKFKR